MRRGNRWIVPAVVLGIVVLATVAFTLHGLSAWRVTGTPAMATTGTPVPPATGVPHIAQASVPSRTPMPVATRPAAPSSTAVSRAPSTAVPPSSIIPVATSTNAPTATSMALPTTAVASATTVPAIQSTAAADPLTTAAAMLARIQLGYAPTANDPMVGAFAQELTVLQPICNVGMVPLAYQIANVTAGQAGGAHPTLLTMLSKLTKRAGHDRKHGDVTISCANLFAAYAQPRTDNQGGNGYGKSSDSGNQD